MKIRQKKILSAFLAVSSIMGIVVPTVNANATPIEDELNSTAEELKAVIKEYSEKLAKKPNFANHHRVNYAAERLEKYDSEEAAKAKSFIAQYDSQVFTQEILLVITKMDTFSNTKNMQLFDELLNVDIPELKKTDEESAEYLKSRLDVWGQAVVFDADPNYAKATDEIIKIQTLREQGKLEEAASQVNVAKEAISKIATLELNGPYLEAKLKIQEDLVNEEIAKLDLYVRSVEALNAREILVTFNRDIASHLGEDSENYEIIPTNSSAKDIKIEGAELNDDKSVKLTVSGLNNKKDANYLVKIKNIGNTEETEMPDYAEIINLYDNTLPTITSVNYDGANKQIDIDFSEPIYNFNDCSKAIKLKLDGANINLKEEYFDPGETSCSIYLSDANLDKEKIYNVEVNGLTDFAGNALEKYTGEIVVTEDDEKPAVDSIDVLSRKDFCVNFTEDIKDDDFKVSIDDKKEMEGLNKTDDYEFQLTDVPDDFQGKKLITIYDYEDKSGNKGEPITKEVYFQAKHPKVKNKEGELEVDGDKRMIVFKFNAKLKQSKFKVEAKHKDKDGITIKEDIEVVVKNEAKKAKIDITNLDKGEYRFDFEASQIVDIYDQKVEKTSVTFINDISKKTARVSEVKSNNQKEDEDKVIVKFDNEVGDDALIPSNYTIDGEQVFKDAIFKEDRKTVELTLKEGAIVTTGEKTFKVEGLKNVKDYIQNHTFQENVKPEISKAEVISYNKIKLSMTDTISSEYTIDERDMKVRVNDQCLRGSIKITGQGTDTLVITLDDVDKLNGSEDKVTIEILEDNTIADLYGNTMEAQIIKDIKFNPDTLYDTASEAIEKLKDACDKDLTVEENMKAAEAAKEEAKKAVAELNDGSVDKGNLEKQIEDYEAKIKNVKAYLEDAEKKIKALEEKAVEEKLLTVKDIDEAYELVKPAEDSIAILKDTSVYPKFNERLTGAKELIMKKKDICDKVKAECEKLTLEFDKTANATSEKPLIMKPALEGFEFTLSFDEKYKENLNVLENGNIEVTRSEEDKKDIIITVKVQKDGVSTTKNLTIVIPKGEGEVIITPESAK